MLILPRDIESATKFPSFPMATVAFCSGASCARPSTAATAPSFFAEPLSPSKGEPPFAVAAPLYVEGKTSFHGLPRHEDFRFVLASDKLETVIVLEARTSRKKWECRMDDAKLRVCGPHNVELPRYAVVAFLLDKLQDPSTEPHRLRLQTYDSGVTLVLALVFGTVLTATYNLPMEPSTMSREDSLQAQVHELQDELEKLRKQMADLRYFVQLDSSFSAARTPPPPMATTPLAFGKLDPTPPVDSARNAKATADSVFGQPHSSSSGASSTRAAAAVASSESLPLTHAGILSFPPSFA